MGHLSKIALNLTHFYTNPNFLLALWRDLAELSQKQLEVLKKSNVKHQFMVLKRVAKLNGYQSPTVGQKYKSKYSLESRH